MSTSSEPSDSSRPRSQTSTLEGLLTPPERQFMGDSIHGKRAVLIALGANLCIGGVKLLAGLMGGQSSMLSEAMHSLADSVNSGFLLIGLQKGNRAPDKSHPFGYGLETTLWAMLATVLMFALALLSIWLGVQRFLNPQELEGFGLSAGVLAVSIVIEVSAVRVAMSAVLNEQDIQADGFFNRLKLAFRHVKTVSSPTTRFVFYEDTVALLGAIIALIAISISEFGVQLNIISPQYAPYPDASASVLIGLMLLGLSLYLFSHNSKGLTGSAASSETERRIREFVGSLTGVSQVHDFTTIDYGISGIVVHMRVEVDPNTQVKDVDDLMRHIKDRVRARFRNVKEVITEVLADESGIEWQDKFYELIAEGREAGILKAREEQILKNVFEFSNSVVGDIMVPRTDVDCIEITESLEVLMDMVIESGHTRIPAYDDDIDNMLGAIHAKDVFQHARDGKKDIDLRELVRPFDIYPENKAVGDLLEEFKRRKIQIAMVADEHGGFAGIVTIEDLLEEIVGEMFDEYDDDLELMETLSPTQLLLSGKTDIDELNDRYSLSIPDTEFNTVGGFVFGLLGREPKEDDVVTFEDLTFTIREMDGHRVDKVEIESPIPFVTKQDEDEDIVSNGSPA